MGQGGMDISLAFRDFAICLVKHEKLNMKVRLCAYKTANNFVK